MENREKTTEQLKEDLRKTREELGVQKWGIEKTLGGMKVLVKELIQKGKEVKEASVKDEAILASIGDGLVAVDKEGKILMVNKAFENLVGWKVKEVLGKLLVEVVPREDEAGNIVPFNERILNKVLSTTTTTDWYYLRKDKTRFPVASIITPFILEGKIIGAVEVFRDITKEKDIDQAKTEFVSLASHQLRTPLTDVSWHTEMILKGDLGEVIPGQKKYLDAIYRGNQRMIELVNTLLDVSRLELGTFKVTPSPTDIIALAQSVLDEQKSKIEKKKLIIVEKLSKDVPTFSTDPKLLRMVFQNLLANSVEYTPPKGTVHFEIALDTTKKNILITVADTGYGIPKNQQDKVYEKFFRADNVRDKDTDGTGLGLYIVKSIVENAGGKIWFKSPYFVETSKGKEEIQGTTFYVTLPFDGLKKSA